MKKSLSIILLIFVTAFSAFAQAPVLTGTLKDSESKQPLAGATVKLVSGADSVTMLSNKDGIFEFKNLAAGTYKLSASFSGYEVLSKEVIWENKTLRLGEMTMNKEAKTLQSVTVISTPPPVRQKTDTTEFSANQFKVNPDANVEDLVKKMPGITVGRDGTVTAQGEQVRKVTIDGRDFFGDDASAALRNLPAEIVDKIQVFDRLSDQAQFTGVDDGNSQRAINVVTRAGMRNGQFGRIYAGYGTDNRYQAGGNVSFFKENRRISLVGLSNNINQQNFGSQDLLGLTSSGGGGGFRGGFGGGGGRGGFGGWGGGQGNFLVGQQNGISKTNAFGINYNDKWGTKTDVQASYFFNNSKNENDAASQSQTLFQGKTQYIDQKSLSVSKNYNHRFNLRVEHRIDSNNSIIISPSFNFQKNNSISEAISRTLSNADTVNTADNFTQSLRDGFNIRNNILYRHSFARRGRTFSVNLNTTFDKNDGESYVTSHYRFYNQFGFTDSLQDQYLLNPTNGYNLSANMNYTEPVGKNGQLQFNYSPSYSKNKANQQTYTYDMVGEKYSKFDTTLSNKFDNITRTQNGGITYRYSPNRDDQISFGVNLQHSRLESERVFPTTTQVNQTFTNVLPNFQYRKKISARSNIRVFYRARTNFPSVTQLQDVVNQSNPLRVSSGNPELKQSYLHFISGRYVFTNTKKGQSFFANIFLQTASDYISNATFIPTADSTIQQGIVLKANTQFTKPVNLDGYRSLRSFLTYGMPLKFIKSTINLNAGFNYSKLPGLANNVSTVTHNYVYNGGIVVASNISEYVDFNVSYSANFNNAKSSVLSEVNKFINQSAGLQLNLLSKKGWFLQNDVSYQKYTGDGINQDYTLWNAGVGKKFLKNHGAELKLSVFDLLKQNQSVYRTVAENYIEDSQSKVLQQYFMLTFTYNLKNFGKMPARPMNNNRGNDFRRF